MTSQYRCETCKKPHKVPDGVSRHRHFFCCVEVMPYNTAISTEMRGGVSHSDFQSEREKVLDELDKWIDEYSSGIIHGQNIKDKLKELRKGGERK